MNASSDWTERRWREAADAVSLAPEPWRNWAYAELTRCDVGAALARRHGWHAPAPSGPAGAYDVQRTEDERTASGQFFTPPAIADALVRLAGETVDHGVVLDPACGAGELLCAVFRRRRALGQTVATAMRGLTGWDLDPTAAWGARVSLVLAAIERPDGDPPDEVAVHGAVDALRCTFEADAVVMNPPYLEAKRMRRAQPGLREWLRDAFPELHGAFDLYMAFLYGAIRWLAPGGRVVAVLPNKVCQGRYAAHFRTDGPLSLSALEDLSRMAPRPFPGTSVYPVLVALQATAAQTVAARHVGSLDALHHADVRHVDPAAYRRFTESPWFVPFDTWPILARLLDLPRLATIATVRSTCSFHRKGLREAYVVPERPDGPAYPYIGGPSYTRTSEVGPWTLSWAGWWIRADSEALREAGNPLPSFDDVFLRPKLVIRQHARRVEAWVDTDGQYVTKDVYPVAWPAQGVDLNVLAAIMCSTVFTALYNTVYQGIVVGGETYHYLPAFLRQIPVPDRDALADLVPLASRGGEAWLELDRAVARAYGVSEDERSRLVDTHLKRVGAAIPR